MIIFKNYDELAIFSIKFLNDVFEVKAKYVNFHFKKIKLTYFAYHLMFLLDL